MIGLFLWIFTFLDVSASELVVCRCYTFFFFLFELVCVWLSLTCPLFFSFFLLRPSYSRSVDVRNLPIAEEDEKDKDHPHVVPQINSESESTQRGMHSADIIFFFFFTLLHFIQISFPRCTAIQFSALPCLWFYCQRRTTLSGPAPDRLSPRIKM